MDGQDDKDPFAVPFSGQKKGGSHGVGDIVIH